MTLKLNKTCEGCGYVPLDVCLLALVYIDGCADGNDPSNYKTLCALCQRAEAAMSVYLITPEEVADQRRILRKRWRSEGRLGGRNY